MTDETATAELAKPKRKAKESPTARTMAYCRKRGWEAGKVEQRVPGCFITRDLFGFVDLVVLDGRRGLLGIQVTSGANVAHRMRKIEDPSEDGCLRLAKQWLAAGLRLEVHGWRKTGKAGDRKRWSLRRVKAELVNDVLVWDELPEDA